MTVDVEVEAVIGRPPAVVAGYAGDPGNAPMWYRRISSVEWQTQPPVAVGSRMTFRADFLGRQLTYTYEVTELEPDRRLTMTTAQGPFPMTTEYRWEPVGDDATRMALRNHGDPSGFSRLTAPMMALAMRRAMAGDLRRLAELLEASDGPEIPPIS